MRRNPLAHTGHEVPQLIDTITREALKRAALARTYAESLDIVAVALLEVAFLSKSEVRSHG